MEYKYLKEDDYNPITKVTEATREELTGEKNL